MSNPPPIPDARRELTPSSPHPSPREWLAKAIRRLDEPGGFVYSNDLTLIADIAHALSLVLADCERLQQENTALRSEIMAGVDALIDANDQSPADLLEGIKLLEVTCNAEHAQLTASQQEVTRLTAALTTLRDELSNSAGSDPDFETNRKLKRKWADTLTHLLTGETR